MELDMHIFSGIGTSNNRKLPSGIQMRLSGHCHSQHHQHPRHPGLSSQKPPPSSPGDKQRDSPSWHTRQNSHPKFQKNTVKPLNTHLFSKSKDSATFWYHTNLLVCFRGSCICHQLSSKMNSLGTPCSTSQATRKMIQWRPQKTTKNDIQVTWNLEWPFRIM